MSPAPLENVDTNGADIGLGAGTLPHLVLSSPLLPSTANPIGDHRSPQSAPTQVPQGVSNFVDGSGPIYSMYLEMATEEDKKMAEDWKADADGILIFTGLFSAAVASLISVSIQDIRPNPQDTSNFYLANIYRTVADPNGFNISSPLLPSPPTFSPPNYAVWVNSLWFMSLVISLTSALLATLLQQWARRYLKATQPRYSLHRRARIRTFFAEGVGKFLVPWAVEALPTLLHISLFLFFAGLVVFLCNINLTVFKLVLSWVSICIALYGCITVTPLFRHDSPYYTPLTSLAWRIIIGALYLIFRVLRCFTSSDYICRLKDDFYKMLSQGTQKAAEETALNLPSEIDTRAFMWTFDSLDEDHELERFFFGLPGFRRSKVVVDPLPSLTKEEKQGLFKALIGLLDRTFSSDLLPKSDKIRRAIICATAIAPAEIPDAYQWVLNRITYGDQHKGLRTGEFGLIVRDWAGVNQGTASAVQAVLAGIVATAEQRNDSWFILASDELGVPETVLRDYGARGDSLSFTILIHIVRQQFNHFWKSSWPEYMFSRVLEEVASHLNVQATAPELQHEFCALWNQIVLEVRDDNAQWMASKILGPIRDAYMALHRHTGAVPTQFSASNNTQNKILWEPSSYPLCNIPDHHPDLTSHTNDTSTSTTVVRTVLRDNAALTLVSLTGPDAPCSSITLRRVDKSLTDVPPLDDDIYVPRPFHPAHQTAVENLHISISQDPVTACTAQGGVDTSTTTISLSTSEPLVPTPPTSMASTSPPIAVTAQHMADCSTYSEVLDVPSLPSSTPVLEDMPPTGRQLSLDPSMTGPHASSPPDPHSSLLGPAAPGVHSCLLSPELDAATEGEGRVMAALHKGNDPLDPPSAIREKIMAAIDSPTQSPPPSSVGGITIAGPSWRSPGVRYTGDHPSHSLHGQFNIV